MDKPGMFKIWMAQIRANFLILAVLLVAIGLALSYKYQTGAVQNFNIINVILLLIGVVSAHISVNLFNEYSDFKTKIDFNTQRTPFSGGSGVMTRKLIKPKKVLSIAVLTLILSSIIGIYFALLSHWLIILISLIGAFSILFYTNVLTKYVLGELIAGLTLGSLVVIGTFIAINGNSISDLSQLIPTEVYLLSIPPGILTSLLLLINQFPDSEADKEGGRRHLVIVFGKKAAAYIYTFGMFLTFGTIVILPILGISTSWIYLALLPLPLAVKASVTAIKYGHDNQKLIPALGSNVITVLATDLLLAVAIIIDII